jgi:hypothetical protein
MFVGIVCRRALVASAALALAASTVVAAGSADAGPGSGSGIAKAAPAAALRLNFDGTDFSGSAPVIPNLGSATLDVAVVTMSGGQIAPGQPRVRPAVNKAIRTPAHDASPAAPRAVVRVVDGQGADDLDPGKGAFVFGADFALDAVSESHHNGSLDNGNNLVQRGLFNNVSQYKIQVDGTAITCRVKGRAGVALVTSPMPIAAGRWYRVRCERDANRVTLSVTRWQSGRPVTVVTTATARTGLLTPAASTVPLSVGGKLSATGALVPATDQFNGRVDNVILRHL